MRYALNALLGPESIAAVQIPLILKLLKEIAHLSELQKVIYQYLKEQKEKGYSERKLDQRTEGRKVPIILERDDSSSPDFNLRLNTQAEDSAQYMVLAEHWIPVEYFNS